MPRAFVVNASPLILLARVQRLDLLASLADSIYVPNSVLSELEAGNERDGAADSVRSSGFLQIVPDLVPPPSVELWDLGAGESQVLAQALKSQGFEAMLDDQAARHCASSLRVPVIGTLGVVVTCRKLGLIPTARPLLKELRKAGMRLKPSLMAAALASIGESVDEPASEGSDPSHVSPR